MGMVIVLVVIVILYHLLTVTQIKTLRENDTLCNIWELTWLYTVYKLSVSWSYRSKHGFHFKVRLFYKWCVARGLWNARSTCISIRSEYWLERSGLGWSDTFYTSGLNTSHFGQKQVKPLHLHGGDFVSKRPVCAHRGCRLNSCWHILPDFAWALWMRSSKSLLISCLNLVSSWVFYRFGLKNSYKPKLKFGKSSFSSQF